MLLGHLYLKVKVRNSQRGFHPNGAVSPLTVDQAQFIACDFQPPCPDSTRDWILTGIRQKLDAEYARQPLDIMKVHDVLAEVSQFCRTPMRMRWVLQIKSEEASWSRRTHP